MFTKSPSWGWLLLLLVGIHSISGSGEHPETESSFGLPFTNYLHDFLQLVDRLLGYSNGKGSGKIGPPTLEKPPVLQQDLSENYAFEDFSEMDEQLDNLVRRRRNAEEKGVTEQADDLSSAEISEATYVQQDSEEESTTLGNSDEEEDATYEPIPSVTQASSEEAEQVDQTDWKEVVHTTIKTRYKNYKYTNVSVVPLKRALLDSDSDIKMSLVVPPDRTEKFKTMRATIRKRWAVRDHTRFTVKRYETKLKEDSHVKDLLKGWSPEDLEMLWIWSFQNVIFDFEKFENFYRKTVKTQKSGWENDIYALIKIRYPKLNYPNVTVIQKNATSYYDEDDERYSVPEDDNPNSKQNKRIDKFSNLRTALRTRWNLQEQSDFSSDYFWQQFSNDTEIQQMVKDWDNDDLELLWMWSFQRATNDFPQFENFYKRIILGKKEGWRKSSYEMLKKWYKVGKKTNWIVVDPPSSVLEGGDKGGPEEYLVEPDLMRAVRFTRTRSILRRKWGIGEKDEDHLERDFYDEKFKTERDGILRSWTEHDLEMLRAWMHQNDTKDFLKFERFFNRIVQNIKEGWQKEILELLKPWFDKQNREDSTVHLANSTTEGRHPQDEEISEERIETFQNLKRTLRKRWNIKNDTDYSSDDFHRKLRKDNQAKELVKNLSDEDLEMLWIWLIQTSNEDFPQFENFYRRTVKITKNEWQPHIYELLKSRTAQLKKKNITLLDIDSDAFKTTFKNIQPTQGGTRKEEIDAYYKLRRIFRTTWNTTEKDFKKNFIKKLGTDNYTRELLGGLEEKEIEKLWIWVSQTETDDYPTFEAFISSIMVIQKPRWKLELYQFFQRIYPNDTISTRILEPNSYSSKVNNYEEYDGAITSDKRRQDFSSLRNLLRKKWKAKDKPLSDSLQEFRQKLQKSKEAKQMVENWSEQDFELLWLFTSQVSTGDFKKFERFFWQISRFTKTDWRKNISERLKKKYGSDSNVQLSGYDESKWAEEDANYCLHCSNKKPKEAVLQEERLSLLRQLIRRRWKLVDNETQMDFEEFESKLLDDEHVQSYMVKAVEENLRAFWLFNTQNDITDYDLLLKFLKDIIKVEHRDWQMRIYEIAKERYKNYPNSEVEVLKPDTSDSEESQVSSETTELPEGYVRDQNERDYRQLRLITRLRWKIPKMEEFRQDDFEKRLENDKVVQELLQKLNPSDMDEVWIWIYQDAIEDYFKFKRLYYKIVKDRSEVWTTELPYSTTDIDEQSSTDSSTPTASETTEDVPSESTTIMATEDVTEATPHGSTEDPTMLSSTMTADTSSEGASSDAISTVMPSGRAMEQPKSSTPDLKPETSTQSDPELSKTTEVPVDNSTPIAATSDQTDKPTGSPAQSTTDSSTLSASTLSENVTTENLPSDSTTTSAVNVITTETITEATPHGSTNNPKLFSSTMTADTSTEGISSEAISTVTPSDRAIEQPKITTPDLKPETSTQSDPNLSDAPSTAVVPVDNSTQIASTSDQTNKPAENLVQSTTDSSAPPATTPFASETTEDLTGLSTTSAANIVTTEAITKETPHGSTEGSKLLSSTMTADTSSDGTGSDAISTVTPSGRAIEQPKSSTPDLKPETSTQSDPNLSDAPSTAVVPLDNSTPIAASTDDKTDKPEGNPAQSTTDSSTPPATTRSAGEVTEDIPVGSSTSSAVNIIPTEAITEAPPHGSTEDPNLLSSTMTVDTSSEGTNLDAISTVTPCGRASEEPKSSTPDLKSETEPPSDSTLSEAFKPTELPLDNITPIAASTSNQTDEPAGNPGQSTTDSSTPPATTPFARKTTEDFPLETSTSSSANVITTEAIREATPHGSTQDPKLLSSTMTADTSTKGSSSDAISTVTPSGRAIEEPRITTPDLKPETSTQSDPELSEAFETTELPMDNSTPIASTSDRSDKPAGHPAQSTTDSSTLSASTLSENVTTENLPSDSTTTSAVNVITTETITEATPHGSTEVPKVSSSTMTVDTSTEGTSSDAISTIMPSGRGMEQPKVTTQDLEPETSTPSDTKPSDAPSTTMVPVDNSTPIAASTDDKTDKPEGNPAQSTTDSSTSPATTPFASETTEYVPFGSSASSAANIITTGAMTEAMPHGSTEDPILLPSTITVDTSSEGTGSDAISTVTPSGRAMEQSQITTPDLESETSTPSEPELSEASETTELPFVNSTPIAASTSDQTNKPTENPPQSTTDSSTPSATTLSAEDIPIGSSTSSAGNVITTETITEAPPYGSTNDPKQSSSTMTANNSTEKTSSDAISTVTPSGRAIQQPKITTPDLKLETSTQSDPNLSEVSKTTELPLDNSTPIAAMSDQTDNPTGNLAQSTTVSSALPATTQFARETTEYVPLGSSTSSVVNIITTETITEATPHGSTKDPNLSSSTMITDTSTKGASSDAISTVTPSGRAIEEPRITTPYLKSETSTQSDQKFTEVPKTTAVPMDNSTPIASTSDQGDKPTGHPGQSTTDSSTQPAATSSVNTTTDDVSSDSATTSAVNIVTTEDVTEATPHGSTEDPNLSPSTLTDTSTKGTGSEAVSTVMPSGRAIEEPIITTPDFKTETSTTSDPNLSDAPSTAVVPVDNSTPTGDNTDEPEGNSAQSTTDSSTVPATTRSADEITEDAPFGSSTSSAANVITTETIPEALPHGSTDDPNLLSSTMTADSSTKGTISTVTPRGRAMEQPESSTPDLKPETSTESDQELSEVSKTTEVPVDNSTPIAAMSDQTNKPTRNPAQSTTDSSTLPGTTPLASETTEDLTGLSTSSAANIVTTEAITKETPHGSTEDPNLLSSTMTVDTSSEGTSLDAISTVTPSGRAIEQPKITTPDLKPETSTKSDPNLSEAPSTAVVPVENSTPIAASTDDNTDKPQGITDSSTATAATPFARETTEDVLSGLSTSSAANILTTRAMPEATPHGSTEDPSLLPSTITVDTSSEGTGSDAISTVTPRGRAIEQPQITTPDLEPEISTQSYPNLSEAPSTAVVPVDNSTPIASTSDQTNKPAENIVQSTTDVSSPPATTLSENVKTEILPSESTTNSAVNIITTEAITEAQPYDSTNDPKLLSSTMTADTSSDGTSLDAISTVTPSGRAIEQPKSSPDLKSETEPPSDSKLFEASKTTELPLDNTTPIAASTSNQTDEPAGNPLQSTTDSSAPIATTPFASETTEDVLSGLSTSSAANIITTGAIREVTPHGSTEDPSLLPSTITVDTSSEGTGSDAISTVTPRGRAIEQPQITTPDLEPEISTQSYPNLSEAPSTAVVPVDNSTPIASTSDQTNKPADNIVQSTTDISSLPATTLSENVKAEILPSESTTNSAVNIITTEAITEAQPYDSTNDPKLLSSTMTADTSTEGTSLEAISTVAPSGMAIEQPQITTTKLKPEISTESDPNLPDAPSTAVIPVDNSTPISAMSDQTDKPTENPAQSTTDSSTPPGATPFASETTENVPFGSSTSSAANIITTEAIAKMTPHGSTEDPKMLSSTMTADTSTKGISSEAISTVTPSGSAIEQHKSSTPDLKPETSTQADATLFESSKSTELPSDNRTPIASTSDKTEIPTQSTRDSSTPNATTEDVIPIASTTSSATNTITTEAMTEVPLYGSTENPNLSPSTLADTSTKGTGSEPVSTVTPSGRAIEQPKITTPDLKPQTSTPSDPNLSNAPSTAVVPVDNSTPIAAMSDQTDKPAPNPAKSTTDSSTPSATTLSAEDIPIGSSTSSAVNIITTEDITKATPHGGTEDLNLLSSTMTADTSSEGTGSDAITTVTPSGRAMEQPQITTPDLKRETSTQSDAKLSEASKTTELPLDNSTPMALTRNQTDNPAQSSTVGFIPPAATPSINATTKALPSESTTTSAVNIITTDAITEATPHGSTEIPKVLSSTMTVDTSTEGTSSDAISTIMPSGRGMEQPKVTTQDLEPETSTPSNTKLSDAPSTTMVPVDNNTPIAASTDDKTDKPEVNPAQSTTGSSTPPDATPFASETTEDFPLGSSTSSAANIMTTEAIAKETQDGSTEDRKLLSSTMTADTSSEGTNLDTISTVTPRGRAIEQPIDSTSELKPSTSPSDPELSKASKTTELPLVNNTPISATSSQTDKPTGSPSQSRTDSSNIPATTRSQGEITEVPFGSSTSSAANSVTTEAITKETPHGSTEDPNLLSSTMTVDTSSEGTSLDAISTVTPSGRAIEQPKITTPDLKPETSTKSDPNLSEVSKTTEVPVDNSTPIATASDQTEKPTENPAQSSTGSSLPVITPSGNATTEDVPTEPTTTSAVNIITTETIMEVTPHGSTEGPKLLSSTMTVDTSTKGTRSDTISTVTPSGRAIEQPKVTPSDLKRETSTQSDAKLSEASKTTELPLDNSTPMASTRNQTDNPAQSSTVGFIPPAATPSINATTENLPSISTTTSSVNVITTETAPHGSTEDPKLLSSTVTTDTSTNGSGLEAISTVTPSGRAIEQPKVTSSDLKRETSTQSKLSEASKTTELQLDNSTPMASTSNQTDNPAGNPEQSTIDIDSAIPPATLPSVRETTDVPIGSSTSSAPYIITTEVIAEATPHGSREDPNLLASMMTVDTGTGRFTTEAISNAARSSWSTEEPIITTSDFKPEIYTGWSPTVSEDSSTTEDTLGYSLPIDVTNDQTEKPLHVASLLPSDSSPPSAATPSISANTENVPIESTTSAVNMITIESLREATPRGSMEGYSIEPSSDISTTAPLGRRLLDIQKTSVEPGSPGSSASGQSQDPQMSTTPTSDPALNITTLSQNGSSTVLCNNSYISNDDWKKLLNDDHEKLTVISTDSSGDKPVPRVSKNGNITNGQLVNIMYISGGKTVDGGKGIILGGDCHCTSNSPDGRKLIYIAREEDITNEQKDLKSQPNRGTQDTAGSQNTDANDKQTKQFGRSSQGKKDKSDVSQLDQNGEDGKSKQRLIILNNSNFESSNEQESIFAHVKSKNNQSWSNSNGAVFAASKEGPGEAIAVVKSGSNPEATAINFSSNSEIKEGDQGKQDMDASNYSADIKNMHNSINSINNDLQSEVSKQMSQMSSMFPGGGGNQQGNLPFTFPQHNFNNNRMQLPSFPSNFHSSFGNHNNGQRGNSNGHSWSTSSGHSSSTSSSTFHSSKTSSSNKGSSGSTVVSASSRKKRDIQSTSHLKSMMRSHPQKRGATGVGNNDMQAETWKPKEGSILKFLMKYNPFRANYEVISDSVQSEVSSSDPDPTPNKRRFTSILEILRPSYPSKLSIDDITEKEK